MPINAAWHRRHPMPKRPTLAQRIDWHLEHARECACRSMSPELMEVIRRERGSSALRGITPARPAKKTAGKARKPRRKAGGT